MDIRQLGYFVSLFEEGSTTRAARRMNVVQPALSMQIAKLEDELGQKLFERTSQGMVPTSAGQLAYRLFAPILRDLSEAKQQVVSRASTVSGRIAVGLVASVATSVLARALTVFASQYPEVEISACDGYSDTLTESVRVGTLDFAIVNKARRRSDLPAIDMLDEEMVAVTSAANPRNLGSPLMVRDLASLPLVLPSKRNGLRLIIDKIAEDEDVDLSIRLEVDAVAAIEELIRNSDWVTVLPAIAVGRGLSAGVLRAHRIVAPRMTRQIVCVHNPRRPLSAAARLFVETVTAELTAAADILHRSGTD
jgi:DNA-binding transcriptional LysR family regulator